MSTLALVTPDGYGKRIKVDEIRRTSPGRRGVNVSAAEVAVAEVVKPGDELIVGTGQGQVIRLPADATPMRRRNGNGWMSKGARVIKLKPGDRVMAGTAQSELENDCGDASRPPRLPDDLGGQWTLPGAQKALQGRVVMALGRPMPAGTEGLPTSTVPIPVDEWTATDVHKASEYWCGVCGQECDSPATVYEHLDRHRGG